METMGLLPSIHGDSEGHGVDWGGFVRQIVKKGEGSVETGAPLLVESRHRLSRIYGAKQLQWVVGQWLKQEERPLLLWL